MSGALTIATMTRAEVDFAVGLAAAEGWNPGLHDATPFHATDPDGFLIGRIDGEPIGCISGVSYGGTFGFIGLYIVVPAQRGKGHGIALWRAAMARLAGHNVGLDGVLAQQANYRRSGFALAYSNVRFERSGALALPSPKDTVALGTMPFETLRDFDRRFFPAERATFLRAWIAQPESRGLAAVVNGAIAGYGVIRRSSVGWKIGPLFATSASVADTLYRALCANVTTDEPVYLDVPDINREGMALAQRYGMRQVFGTARMYTGETPALPIEQIYGVTTFELG